MRKVYIYTLSDPITNDICYVGKTYNLNKRLIKHKYEKTSTLKNNWIKKLKKQNLNPIINVIDEVQESGWEFWEQYWISQLKTWGFKLKNMTNGGDGGNTFIKLSPEVQERRKKEMSEYMSNRIISKETKDKLRKNAENRKYSEKTRLKMRNAKIDKIGKLHHGSKPVLQFDLNNKLINKFDGLCEAERSTKIFNTNISKVCNGKRKTAGGFIWKWDIHAEISNKKAFNKIENYK